MGIWRAKKTRGPRRGGPPLPVLDFNKASTRKALATFGVLALVSVVLSLAVGSFKAVHWMESVEFCGTACHTVMQPEYTAYQRSPHVARGVRGLPHRPGGRLVREVEDLGQLAADRGGLRPLPDADPDARAQPAPGPRHLRAVPLAEQVRRRPPEGPHALRRGRAEHRAAQRAADEDRRPARPHVVRHPLARRSGRHDPLPVGSDARDRSTTSR